MGLTPTLGLVAPEFLVPTGVVKRSFTTGTKGLSPERSPERGDREIVLSSRVDCWRNMASAVRTSVCKVPPPSNTMGISQHSTVNSLRQDINRANSSSSLASESGRRSESVSGLNCSISLTGSSRD